MFRKYPKKKKASKDGKRRTLEEMTPSELVEILDTEFSFNLRAGQAAKQGHPYIVCYTCGKGDLWNSSKMHCGHFIGRKFYGTRWSRDNTRIQCWNCNCNNEGNKPVYALRLLAEGVDLEVLQNKADFQGQKKYPNDEMIRWIKEYRAENAKIRKAILGF